MHSRTTISQLLARNLLNLEFENLPSAVVQMTKICIFDTLAGAFGGWNNEISRAVIEAVKNMKGNSDASIWVHGEKTSVADAAFCNAAIAHSMMLEDTHTGCRSHPGSIIIPTVFALGEGIGATGKEALTAIVAGYEAMAHVGRFMYNAEFSRRGFRPSGVFGPFGSSMAAAKL